MVIGICATVDFAFKLLFGSPEHTAVTIHFLNSLLGTRIRSIEILNPILGKEIDEDKLSILDIRAIDDQGRHFNIEMQTSLTTGLVKRMVYYAGSLYVRQIASGESYTSLRPAISICVLDQQLFQHDRLHSSFLLRDQVGDVLCEELQIHTVELPKSRVTEHNIKAASRLEKWVFLLKNAERYDSIALRALLTEPEFQEAIGVLEMISRTPDQRDLYEARLKLQRDEAARLEYALNEGMEKGMEKGIEKGRAEGEQIGQILGVMIGRIQLLQELLGLSVSPTETLTKTASPELASQVEELQRQLRERG